MRDPRRTVLFVDDDQETRIILDLMLRRLGVPCVSAARGADALQILQERGDEIGIMLIDLRMPNMDGMELTTQIRLEPQYAEIPIVLITAASDFGLQLEAEQAGITQYIVKPIKQETLKDLLVDYGLIKP